MLDPLKRELLDQAKAQLEEALKAMPVVDGKILMTNAQFAERLDQLLGFDPDDSLDYADSTPREARSRTMRVRIYPTVAADYQARNVFPNLRPAAGKPLGRYFVDHEVSRAGAQAVFDDAVEQAARGGSQKRRSLTLAYRALAKRTSTIFGEEWSPYEQGAACADPMDFREQAAAVDALLRAVS